VLGTGGTLLAGKIKSDLAGEPIGGTTVSYGRADHRFGFAMIDPAQGDGRFTATFRDNASKKLFGCQIGPGRPSATSRGFGCRFVPSPAAVPRSTP
jgi:hypothetical protein